MIPPLELMATRAQAPLPGAPYHRWELEDGSVWAEFHRRDDDVLLRFPGLADFAVPADGGAAACWPAPGVSAATREHLYLNQVLPFLLARRGRLAFHASAVVIDGRAVAFAGAAGRGKSTLAAAFVAAGHRFLTDDGLIVTDQGGRYMVEPSHPSLRLWDDSRDALVAAGTAMADPVAYTGKSRLLAGETLPFCDEPRPLAAAYFLGEAETDETRIAPLAGAAAVSAWMRHCFLLDMDDPVALARHFEALARFCGVVPTFGLDYPRSYERLDAVRRAIAAHASAARDQT